MTDDLLDRAVTAASDDPNLVAPEFRWRRKGNQWQATNREATKRAFDARPARVVVTPGKPGIYVHGSEAVTWLAYLNGGSKPTGADFKRARGELAFRVGLADSRPAGFEARPLPSTAPPPPVPIEPIPPGEPQPFRDRWPFKDARRVHQYAWGFMVYPAKGNPLPCRPSPIGLICGTREGPYALHNGRWRTPKGEPGEKIRGIPDVSPEALTTYRHREARAAIERGDRVWFCEGEKDVETAEALGLVADCNPFGAGKLTPEQARTYRGGRVVLIPDHDAAGQSGAELSGFRMLEAAAAEARIVEPFGGGGGYDLTDHVTERRRAGVKDAELVAELEERAERAQPLAPAELPRSGPKVHMAREVALDVSLDAGERLDKAAADPESVYGIRTGIPKLDFLTLGLNPGLIILAAPPAFGKSTLAMSITLHALKADRVLFLSWEHSAASLVRRLVCNRAGLDTMDVRRGRHDHERLAEAVRKLAPQLEHLAIIETDPSLTREALGDLVRAEVATGAPAGRRLLVVVDYLQLVARASGELATSDPRGKVDQLSGALIALARSAEVPILAISAQPRAAYIEGKASSSIATLKESGSLEYDADLVMTMTRPEDEDAPDGDRVLHLGKNREGPTGKIPLRLDLKSGRVHEIDSWRL